MKMLKVNGKIAEIKKTRFILSKYIHNGTPSGYCGHLEVKFEIDGKDGYFDFDVDVIKDKNIFYYENKEYCCIPEDNIKEINYLEIFDTNTFYDIGTFFNKMTVKFKEIKNKKIHVQIMVDETVVSLEFDDDVNIII